MARITKPLIAILAFTVLLASAPAWALVEFRCGTYRVAGTLRPAGESGAALSILLFEGSASEVVLPLKVLPGKPAATKPVTGEFDIEVDDGGARPAAVRLVATRPLSAPLEALGGDLRTVRLLKARACTVKRQRPSPSNVEDYPSK